MLTYSVYLVNVSVETPEMLLKLIFISILTRALLSASISKEKETNLLECFNGGTLINGTCLCKDGYSGKDCYKGTL